MEVIKVLIISYYWPPSGGAGVQRWVKLTKYFKEHHLKPYVITVHENSASYMNLDPSLNKDVASEVEVHKTNSFEPINYYAKLVGKKNVPTAGFSNVDNQKIGQKIVNTVRSNFFVPDPRRGWNRYAYKKAEELIKREKISIVLTTSPPHSSQLIGRKLQQNLGVKWVADLRDPWTDVYYYKLLGHSVFSKALDRFYEKQVLQNADQIITVSEDLKRLFIEKSKKVVPEKIQVLPNGYDPADYKNLQQNKSNNGLFTICYTGTMSNEYQPMSFIEVLKEWGAQYSKQELKLQFVGIVSEKIKEALLQSGLNVEFVPYVPHEKVIHYQVNADLLLLVIPQVENSRGILTGKLFEYLASNNRIICIGPKGGDAAKIITKCQQGQTFEREEKNEMTKYLEQAMHKFKHQQKVENNQEQVQLFSRQIQAKTVRSILTAIIKK